MRQYVPYNQGHSCVLGRVTFATPKNIFFFVFISKYILCLVTKKI